MPAKDKTSVWATYLLILVTLTGFLFEISVGIERVKQLVLSRENFFSTGYVILSYGFLHSGLSHLTGNMVSLFVQGKILERTVGSLKMTFIYLLGIIGGGVAYLIFNPSTTVAGASAATSAIMAANMAVSPGRSLVDEIPLLRRFPLPGLRSILNVSFWAAVAILVNIQLAVEGSGSTAVVAHLGGIMTGVASVFLFTNKGTKKGLLTTAGFAAALSTVALVNPESVVWKMALLGIFLLIIAVRRTRKRSV